MDTKAEPEYVPLGAPSSNPLCKSAKGSLGIVCGLGCLMAIGVLLASFPADKDLKLDNDGTLNLITNLKGIGGSLRGMDGLGSSPLKNFAINMMHINSLANQGVLPMQAVKGAMQSQMKALSPAGRQFIVKAEQSMLDKVGQYPEMGMKGKLPANFDRKALPGVTKPLGFWDPWGLSAEASAGTLLWWKEAELKNGRVAMLAILGIIVQENFHPLIGDFNGIAWSEWKGLPFKSTDIAKFWPAVAAAIALPIEVSFINKFQPPDTEWAGLGGDYEAYPKTDDWWKEKLEGAGDLGFDPLRIKRGKTPKQLREMQDREINNGRLAMLATMGVIVQEYITGKQIFGPN